MPVEDLIKAAAGRVLAAKEYGNIQEEFNKIFNHASQTYGQRLFVKALYESLREDPVAYNYARQMVYRARYADKRKQY